MTFYNSEAFAGWKGNILIGSLGTGSLVRLTMAGGKVTSEERYEILGGQRVRDVQVGPDGLIYLVTDEDDGALVRVKPSEK